MDNLTRIERQYGCVTEYHRCMEEEADRRWEQAQQAHLRYEENRRQIDEYRKTGHYAICEAFCDVNECHSCKTRTRTFYSDEHDDIGVFFCLDSNCKCYKVEGSKES